MANNSQKKGKKTSKGTTRVAAPVRATSGAGFEFEDLFAAWLWAKTIAGEPIASLPGTLSQIQSQTGALGWEVDDLLATAGDVASPTARLAISCKGNVQVSASGLPADFASRAWRQWRTPGPFDPASDSLALVTRGRVAAFEEAWHEIKTSCSGDDPGLAVARIRGTPRQNRIFENLRQASGDTGGAPEAETVELIRRLQVIPVDFQLTPSDFESQGIALCRQALTNADLNDANAMWLGLTKIAAGVRTGAGTLALQNLWVSLRNEFELRGLPDYRADWAKLDALTADYTSTRIELDLSSGWALDRVEDKDKLATSISERAVSVVFGESGNGKSALVRATLNQRFPTWKQVWVEPETLSTALSEARRSTLPLRHPLVQVLLASPVKANVLVIDAAERLDPQELRAVRVLLESVVPLSVEPASLDWRVVIVSQTQGWADRSPQLVSGRTVAPMEVGTLAPLDVSSALMSSGPVRWLASDAGALRALGNLRTLGWVVQAGEALGGDAKGFASPTAIADRLWRFWTSDRADVQALVIRLGEREASFQRSFPLSEFAPSEAQIIQQFPSSLPVKRTSRNHLVFEHDLAADWARFQRLKELAHDPTLWASFAANPLWAAALRMLGQYLARQPGSAGTAWDDAFTKVEALGTPLAAELLLDALCLDPEAERLLNERAELLFANDGQRLNRLLTRFLHAGTIPRGAPKLSNDDALISLFLEASMRTPVVGRWPGLVRFLTAHQERIASLMPPALPKLCETWLTTTPATMTNGEAWPFRRELAALALKTAKAAQIEVASGVMFLSKDEEPIFQAALTGAADLPDEISEWALAMAGRRADPGDVQAGIAAAKKKRAEEHAARMRADAEYRKEARERRRSSPVAMSFRRELPPWPMGASRRIDLGFRKAAMQAGALVPLMGVRPDAAAEILLALIIEDVPIEEFGSRIEFDLGLEFAQDGYPTAFWKSPFLRFLQIAPDQALPALINLVNFCTERWGADWRREGEGEPPGISLKLNDGSNHEYPGGMPVFDWTQENSNKNGNLHCALNALERWLTWRIDAGEDVSDELNVILTTGRSLALLGLLTNIAKYRPALLGGTLQPLLSTSGLVMADPRRVENLNYRFDAFTWSRQGEIVFELARSWTLAEHRRTTLLAVAQAQLLEDADFASWVKEASSNWSPAGNPETDLELDLIRAGLDRGNYREESDEEGNKTYALVYPAELQARLESFQSARAAPLRQLMLPMECERLLATTTPLSDQEVETALALMDQAETETSIDDNQRATNLVALASLLSVRASSQMSATPTLKARIEAILRAALGIIPDDLEGLRTYRIGSWDQRLKFAAHGVVSLWVRSSSDDPEWEEAVVGLLTSGDREAAAAVIRQSLAARVQLGEAWWRLLQIGCLWSALSMLTPMPVDDGDDGQRWSGWLRRFRRFKVRGVHASQSSVKLLEIVKGFDRLQRYLWLRRRAKDRIDWRGDPGKWRPYPLETHFLGQLFGWLIDAESNGTGDLALDRDVALKLWAYEARRMQDKPDRSDDFDLLSQDFGYDLVRKLGAMAARSDPCFAEPIWKAVLALGPQGHHAIDYFVSSMFLELEKVPNPDDFGATWQAMLEYALGEAWTGEGRWYYREELLRKVLGFNHEKAIARVPAALARIEGMRALFERWAREHLSGEEENLAGFAHFLTSEAGAALRLEGIGWINEMLKADKRASARWWRNGTGDTLVVLLGTALAQNGDELASQGEAREAFIGVAAFLASRNIPAALALQERIKLLRAL